MLFTPCVQLDYCIPCVHIQINQNVSLWCIIYEYNVLSAF